MMALRSFYLKLLIFIGVGLLCACTTIPPGIKPVDNFELPRYLGKWYEIARFDHSFEEGLEQVTADYSMREDGGVKVLNRGFDSEKQVWNEAEGKAYFVQNTDVGHLKVAFFGPFYASYVIFLLDKAHYNYALVTGPNRDYLWILARTPQLSLQVQEQILQQAKEAGFATEKLIWLRYNSL